ncbi:MAG: hypothetical protein COB36_14835 [Alphaproteobacteria bacterium]|nr:MAG: hypothetical protein COB36_14835 [Alphaproteobacteria bacterium]
MFGLGKKKEHDFTQQYKASTGDRLVAALLGGENGGQILDRRKQNYEKAQTGYFQGLMGKAMQPTPINGNAPNPAMAQAQAPQGQPTQVAQAQPQPTAPQAQNYGQIAQQAMSAGRADIAKQAQSYGSANAKVQSTHRDLNMGFMQELSGAFLSTQNPQERQQILTSFKQQAEAMGVDSHYVDMMASNIGNDAVLNATYQRGQTYKERVAQENIATDQGLARDKFGQTVINQDRDDVRARDEFGQQTVNDDRDYTQKQEMQEADIELGNNRYALDFQKQQHDETQDANGSGEFGVTPIYGTDADGKRVMFQADKSGGIRQAEIPDGVTLENDFYKSRQKSLGEGRAKLELGRTKAGSALSTAKSKMDMLRQDIQLAISQSKGGNTGPLQGRMSLTKGQSDFNQTIQSVKARIGFGELQEMRDNSPTGGALGQVTEKEIAFLQALKGSIDRAQSEGQLDANLGRMLQAVEQSFERIEAAYQQDYENGLFDNDLIGSSKPKVQKELTFNPKTGALE